MKFYAVRMVKNGPRTACKIFYGGPIDPLTSDELDRSPRWQCWINDELCEDPFQYIIHLDPDGTAIVKGEEIDASEYAYLLELSKYASNYDPTAPEANPRKAVNLRQMAPIKPPR